MRWWLFIGLAALVGCYDTSAIEDAPVSAASQSAQMHLERGWEFVREFNQFNVSDWQQKAVYEFNRWMEQQPENPAWSADPLVQQTLPKLLRQTKPLSTLEQRVFEPVDAEFLRQALWMKEVSDWVLKTPVGPYDPVVAWIDQRRAEIGDEAVNDLTVAARLFDWTVRNIQLDEFVSPDESIGAGSEGKEPLPAAWGIEGPGYGHFPWETLLYGHGDAWERARVFILLCRQQNVDVVMLATAQDSRPLPWLPAALIAEQLYLFDPALGLPIPLENAQGIATLQQVKESPKLLERLDLAKDLQYRVGASDLAGLTALIDASYGCLSLRMAALESQLTGTDRLRLSVSARQFAERLARQGFDPEEGRVRLWAAPHEAYLYREAMLRKMQEDRNLHARYALERGLYQDLNPLVQGRYQHLRGQFDEHEGRSGAKAAYLEVRYSNETIRDLSRSYAVQEAFGVKRGIDEPEEAWRRRIVQAQALMVIYKEHATHWLGLIQYDTGNYSSAANWLSRETWMELLKGTPAPTFRQSSSYNLARAQEQLGNWEEARQIYLLDESPQRHGNWLRARQLRIAAETREERASDSG